MFPKKISSGLLPGPSHLVGSENHVLSCLISSAVKAPLSLPHNTVCCDKVVEAKN